MLAANARIHGSAFRQRPERMLELQQLIGDLLRLHGVGPLLDRRLKLGDPGGVHGGQAAHRLLESGKLAGRVGDVYVPRSRRTDRQAPKSRRSRHHGLFPRGGPRRRTPSGYHSSR